MSLFHILTDKSKRQALKVAWSLVSSKDKRKASTLMGFMLFNSLLEMMASTIIPLLVWVIAFPEKLNRIPKLGPWISDVKVSYEDTFLLMVSATALSFFLLKNGFTVFMNYFQGKMLRAFQITLSRDLLEKYMQAPMSFLSGMSLAVLIRNINGESGRVIKEIVVTLLSLINDILLSLGLITLLFLAEPVASLMAFSMYSLISVVFMRGTQKRISVYAKDMIKSRKKRNKVVINAISFMREIKILNKANFFTRRFAKAQELEAKAFVQRTVMKVLPKSIFEITGITLILMIIIFLDSQSRPQEEQLVILVLFQVVSSRMRPIFTRISKGITMMQYALPSVRIIYDAMFNTPVENLEPTDERPLEVENGNISLQKVSFRYGPDKGKVQPKVLNDVSLDIALGKTNAFVGPSGSGKSTLTNLVLGLFEQEEGEILVNGRDIRTNMPAWRNSIAVVPQNIVVINDTMLNNICLGKYSEEEEERLNKILSICELDEVVEHLANGLKTNLGDGGNRLSGGQKQRLGIARALFSNRPILVFDEATSALDGALEQRLLSSLRTHYPDLTILAVAHRMASIAHADNIFVMEAGALVAQGTYSELLESSELFRDLNNQKDQTVTLE